MSADAIDPQLPVAVIVTYNPPPGMVTRLRAVLAQVSRVIVVDNASRELLLGGDLSAAESDRIEYIRLDRNIGLAAALNRGIERAQALGARQALLLDHDSTPTPGMVSELRRGAASHAGAVAIAAPRVAYAHPAIRCRWPASQPGGRWWFRFAYAARMPGPQTVDLAIGSGMLLDIAAWERIGCFDEALFIDLVDTEFCLRARAAGYAVLAVPQAVLEHTLGEVEQRQLLGVPVYPTHHSTLRHYYLSRNRIILTRRFGWRFPNWLYYETMSALKLTVKVALYEPDRTAKLSSMLRGTLAGIRMAGTPPPPSLATPGSKG